ncbi:ATP-binding protein [Flavobacterium sp. W21_SRS_FM6]|uniref:ATP-binding protein n=1 Tax=Flavobacterium sp. W21_SRS_FM6 TaxID=3240268 RepID=UPI003F92F9CB
MVKANYFYHPSKMLKGNPLAEGLGKPLTDIEIANRVETKFDAGLDLSKIDAEYHTYYKMLSLYNLEQVYTLPDEACTIYKKIRMMIEFGYMNRNPLLGGQLAGLLLSIDSDSENNPVSINNVRSVERDTTHSVMPNMSYLLTGLSGRGKTTLIKKLLNCIPQIIQHETYISEDGTRTNFQFIQIPYLYVELHERRGQKAFLDSILLALDHLTDESYSNRTKNLSINKLITAVRKAFVVHGVGMLIIDEAQNLANIKADVALGNNEKTTVKFVEEIFNRFGIPLFFVGTLKTEKLFGSEMTIIRRTINQGATRMLGCDVDSDFWNDFCDQITPTELLNNQVTSQGIINRHLHNLSCGIPAIAKAIAKATISALLNVDEEDDLEGQDLSIDAMNMIMDEQFHMLIKPLLALTRKKYFEYEDFEALSNLDEAAKLALLNYKMIQEAKTSGDDGINSSDGLLGVNDDKAKVNRPSKTIHFDPAITEPAKVKRVSVGKLLKAAGHNAVGAG